MKKLIVAAAALALAIRQRRPALQDYPSRPDHHDRAVRRRRADRRLGAHARRRHAARRSGRQIIVEDVTGAGGTIGVARAVHAAPDGYTLSIGHLGTHVINGAIYPLSFDLVKDFEPVSLLASNPMMIVSKNDIPAKNLNELIAWIKANSGKVDGRHRRRRFRRTFLRRLFRASRPASNCNSCPIAAPARRCSIWCRGTSI